MKNRIKLLMIAVAFFVSGNLFAQVHTPAGSPDQAPAVAAAPIDAPEAPVPSALEIYIKTHMDDPDVQNYVATVEKLTDPNLTAAQIANLQALINSMTSTLNSNAQGEANKVSASANQSPNNDPVSNHILKTATPGNPSTWSTMFQSTGDAQLDAQIVYQRSEERRVG